MQVAPAFPASASLRLYWPAVAGAASYDVITGDLASWRLQDGVLNLGAVVALAQSTTTTSLVEPLGSAAPAVGQGFFYLIQQRSAQGAAGYGTETAPWPRVPGSCDAGCPGATMAGTRGSTGGGQTAKR